MALQDYAAELKGIVPELDILNAQKIVNSAWRSLCNARLWSFLVKRNALYAPAIITAGTVTVTQLSTNVTCDATAAAALNAVAAANPALTKRQFRSGIGGAIYDISAWTSPNGPLTLAQPYLEASAVNAAYQVYKCYYEAPSTDFVRWYSIYDPDNGYSLKLDIKQQEINDRDPTRGSQGQPYYIAALTTDYAETTAGSGLPRFELWPHPTFSQGYVAYYRRKGLTLVNPTDDIPASLSPDVLMERAKFYAFQWAIANMGRYPTLRGVPWRTMMVDSYKLYLELLRDARVKDDEIYMDSLKIPQYANPQHGLISADFLQNHDLGYYLNGG